MAAAIASTRMESSKIDSAGVESGAKMLVGLIANGPGWRACRVLPFAQPVPGGTSRRCTSEDRTGCSPWGRGAPSGRTPGPSAIPARVSPFRRPWKSGRLRSLRRRGYAVRHLLPEPDERPLHRGDQRVIAGAVDPLRHGGFPDAERLAALADQLPSTLQDDGLSGDPVEARDADRSAVAGPDAGKDRRPPGRDRDLLRGEAIAHRGDESAADLGVERASPAIELRDHELVRAGAGHDLWPVDGLRDLDGTDRQRRIGWRPALAVPDLKGRQRVEPGRARAPQTARQRQGHRAGEQRRQTDMGHAGHLFPFSTASGCSSRYWASERTERAAASRSASVLVRSYPTLAFCTATFWYDPSVERIWSREAPALVMASMKLAAISAGGPSSMERVFSACTKVRRAAFDVAVRLAIRGPTSVAIPRMSPSRSRRLSCAAEELTSRSIPSVTFMIFSVSFCSACTI